MEASLEKLKESLSNIEGVLHRTTAPNLKALEKMREVREKLHEVTEGILLFIFYFCFVLFSLSLLELSLTFNSLSGQLIELFSVSFPHGIST